MKKTKSLPSWVLLSRGLSYLQFHEFTRLPKRLFLPSLWSTTLTPRESSGTLGSGSALASRSPVELALLLKSPLHPVLQDFLKKGPALPGFVPLAPLVVPGTG